MSDQLSFWDTPSATSSPGSGGGPSPSGSPAGPTTGPCGPDPVHASLSASQALEAGLMTRDTYGRRSGGSSTSADLQRYLESRLRVELDGIGSPMYVLTWKSWDMASGLPICALRASALRTSDNGFFFVGRADTSGRGFGIDRGAPGSPGHVDIGEQDGGLAYTDGRHSGAERQQRGGEQRLQPGGCGDGGLADHNEGGRSQFCEARVHDRRAYRDDVARCGEDDRPATDHGGWSDADWLFCRDGVWRPAEPGTFPLANGVPARVGRLRGYGNAIVPQVAAAFVRASL